MSVSIYGLKCPITGEIRYIGQSKSPVKRFQSHLNSVSNKTKSSHCINWLRKLTKDGLKPELVIFEVVDENRNWQDVEREWISLAKNLNWPITNMQPGGEGIDSETLREIWKNPIYREKRISSIKAAYAKSEVKAKFSKIMEEIRARPEVKEKRSRAAKENWRKVEYRQAVISKRDTPEKLKLKSESFKERWKDKDFAERLINSRWDENARTRQRDVMLGKQRKQKMKDSLTPELIRKRNESIRENWKIRREKELFNKESHGVIPFKGVSRSGEKYRSVICIEGKQCCLGTYNTAQEASWAYEYISDGLLRYYVSTRNLKEVA